MANDLVVAGAAVAVAAGLLNTKQIGVLITAAHESEKWTITLYQNAAVQCIMHAAEHGDVTLFERLVRGMTAKGLRAAMIGWAKEFTLINVTEEKAGIVKGKLAEGRKWDINGAIATIFTDFEPEPKQAPLTLERVLKMLEAVEKRTKKAVDKGKVAEGENNIVLLAVAKAARASAQAEANKAA